MNAGLVERIRDVRFTPVRIREGYGMGEVDELLDELAQAVTGGHPVDPLIDAARFTPVRLREGYDMGDVDQFLEEVRAAAAVGPDEASGQRAASAPGRSVIEEHPGLFAKLFRRTR